MGVCISGCVQMLTRMHDRRTLQNERTMASNMSTEFKQLAPAEKQPSVLLVFSIVERHSSEDKTIRFLRKVFRRDRGLVHQRNYNGEALLYFACKQGKARVANYLMDLFGNAGEICSQGSAVHASVHAMHCGNLETAAGCVLITELLEHGCDVDAENASGWTAFSLAAALDCYSALTHLARRNCDATVTGSDGMTPLHIAAANGNIHMVHFLLGLSEVEVNALDDHSRTALTVALMSILRPGYFCYTYARVRLRECLYRRELGVRMAIVERLLMAGADPNAEHHDRKFQSDGSVDYLCKEPIALALYAYVDMKVEGERNKFTSSAFLASLAQRQGGAVAMVTQLFEHGALLPYCGISISMYLLPHLNDILVLAAGGGGGGGGDGVGGVLQEEEDEEERDMYRRVRMAGAGLQWPGSEVHGAVGTVAGPGQGMEGDARRPGPFTLQKICRTCIRVRTAMGGDCLDGLRKLPLPTEIIEFLHFYQISCSTAGRSDSQERSTGH